MQFYRVYVFGGFSLAGSRHRSHSSDLRRGVLAAARCSELFGVSWFGVGSLYQAVSGKFLSGEMTVMYNFRIKRRLKCVIGRGELQDVLSTDFL